LEFNDPRSESDFDPAFYPLAGGCPPPSPESNDRDDRIKLEFCAVYYQLNRINARLTDLRKQQGEPAAGDQERCLLMEVEGTLRLRDALEDRYTPLGVIAEPIAKDGFTVDFKFTFGDRSVLREQRTRLLSSTALLFLSAPDNSVARKDRPAGAKQADHGQA
jgi:hypothetical protein